MLDITDRPTSTYWPERWVLFENEPRYVKRWSHALPDPGFPVPQIHRCFAYSAHRVWGGTHSFTLTGWDPSL